MDIDFNSQCEVPYELIKFSATYQIEEHRPEPDVNWPGGKEIIFSEYTIEIPSRRRHKKTKIVTTDSETAVLLVKTLAERINDPEVEPFAEMTTATLYGMEEEALESE